MSEWKKEVVKIHHQGRMIYGVSYLPEQKKCPMVIFSHGFNGSHGDFAMNSEYLASRGIGAFCFDFCGGSVNSKSDFETKEMTLFTEKEDLCAVIDTIREWENVDQDYIFLFGGSQGGLVSALAAEEYIDKIRGLLLLYPALSIPDNWNERFPTMDSIPDTVELWGVTLGRAFFETIHGYHTFDHIGKFNKNVLIFHGDQDNIISLSYGERAAQHYPNARIEVFPGEEHGFSEEANQKVAQMTYEFVKLNMN